MDSISPNIFVEDINASIEYYKLLGFNLIATVPEQGPDYIFAMMVCGKVTFMFQTYASLASENLPIQKPSGGSSLLLYIQVKEIRKFFEEIKDKVKVLKGLEVTFYGATEFSIQDINGYILTFAEDE